jgi:hypothetical protein
MGEASSCSTPCSPGWAGEDAPGHCRRSGQTVVAGFHCRFRIYGRDNNGRSVKAAVEALSAGRHVVGRTTSRCEEEASAGHEAHVKEVGSHDSDRVACVGVPDEWH